MLRKEKILDEWLILRYRSGDNNAIRHLVKKWHKKIIMYIDYKIHDHQSAQDIAQECWESALNGLDHLKDSRKFGVWILSIAHYKSIDYLRLKSNGVDEIKNDIIQSEEVDIDELDYNNNKISHQLQIALDHLSNSHKNVLKLFYLEGFTIDEITQITKSEKGTIKSQLHYARNALKKYMNQNNH